MIETIYIVGGGRSLKNYDWNLLAEKRVIGINRAFEVLPFAEIIYFTDHQFFNNYKDRGLLQHEGALVTISERVVDNRVVHFRDTGDKGLDLTPGCLRNGKNSGYAAINLAVHMKAKRIILMGFDMSCEAVNSVHSGRRKIALPGKTHWHDGYNRNVNQGVYDKMLPMFHTIAKPLEDIGVEVLNAGESSRINVFRKIPLSHAHLMDL